jgi:uncharacterized repeat protein (TIGR03803 family)
MNRKDSCGKSISLGFYAVVSVSARRGIMAGKQFFVGFTILLAISGLTPSAVVPAAAAQTEMLLHGFNNNGKDGYEPRAGVVFDAAGNLYGTTELGGAYSSGTVFELTPKAGGGWSEKVLHSFNNNGIDGTYPVASVIVDSAGNVYGTAGQGGLYDGGVVFELSPQADGRWTEKILHSFGNGPDGLEPVAGLVFDSAGNLYGTTAYGGAYGDASGGGTAFELMPKAGGRWVEKILHSFNSGTDGNIPYAPLAFDTAGNLYGTTIHGGTSASFCSGCGTVFELTPAAGGSWTESVVHNFVSDGKDGTGPFAPVVVDSAGNIFGTTFQGGTGHCPGGGFACGTVFELSPGTGGGWSETVYSFNSAADGFDPEAALILDPSGNLYGTTLEGGAYAGGTVFELSPVAGGGWSKTLLRSLGHGKDANSPLAGLVFDSSGNLYGTGFGGGPYGWGVVFEVTP